jgi:UDP-N-acetylmuramate dehydrogenase
LLPSIATNVPLAPLTTLQLGGAARYLVEVADDDAVMQALGWADAQGAPVLVLGGGSNLVVSDAGFDGLVIRMASRGLAFEPRGDRTWVRAQAGEPWDALVAATVARGLAGLECLSGIPGLVGATPIQNVGAYGQEVAETIRAVRVIDRATGDVRELPPERCQFGYRDSVFKRRPHAWIVLGVTFALRPGGAPSVRYRELEQALAGRDGGAGAPPSLDEVRETVLRLRRGKSMVIDPADPNRRSAGSFFVNPILAAADADRLVERWMAEGVVSDAAEVPRFPAEDGRVKLSAGWLIERAGLTKGLRAGAVGISSRHALALVHHGGGTTAELLALADQVRGAVARRLGVELSLEPVLVGPSASGGAAASTSPK